jgi:hypothetical protein
MNAAIEWLETGFSELDDFYEDSSEGLSPHGEEYSSRFRVVLASVTSGLFSFKRDHEMANELGWCGACVDASELIVIE